MISRSGTPDYSTSEIRERLVTRGWAPIPIVAHDAEVRSAGKRPAITEWERFARYGAPLPSLAELDQWSKMERSAPSTGIACGNIVVLDLDTNVASITKSLADLAFDLLGATPYLRQGGINRLSIVYRAAEPIKSRALKVAGDKEQGLEILSEGKQCLAFGIHPGTLQPYRWSNFGSPLTGSPDAAPAVTNEQIERFFAAADKIVALVHPTYGAGGGKGRYSAIVRDPNTGLVIDGRETYLRNVVWGTAGGIWAEGTQPFTVDIVLGEAWRKFSRWADLRDGKWTERQARAKVTALVRDVNAGRKPQFSEQFGERGSLQRKIEPAYAEATVDREAGRAEVEQRIREFLQLVENGTKTYPNVRVLDCTAGIGKTSTAARLIVEMINARPANGFPYLLAVPRHNLSEQIVNEFAKHGVAAQVWRGRAAKDPARPGKTMCDDLEAVNAVLKLGAKVEQGACKGTDLKGLEVQCSFYATCNYQAQQRAPKPQVWIAAHEMLFHGQKAIGQVAGVVIDERFWPKGVWLTDPKKGLTLDQIQAPLPEPRDTLLQSLRQKLTRALRRQEEAGGVRREHLEAEGLTVENCTTAIRLELEMRPKVKLYPGMGAKMRDSIVAEQASEVRHSNALVKIWRATQHFLEPPLHAEAAGRATLADINCENGQSRHVLTSGVRRVDEQFRTAPTLIMDATPPPLLVLWQFYPISFGTDFFTRVDVRFPDCVSVEQVTGAPISRRKLLLKGVATAALLDVKRYFLKLFLDSGCKPMGVIAQKEVSDWFRNHGNMPSDIAFEWFNNLAGMNHLSEVRTLVCFGRTQPPSSEMEALAGALLNAEPTRRIPHSNKKGKPKWYSRVVRGARMRDGSVHRIDCEAHHDLLTDAVRWQICEAEQVQAIGRARAINRTEANPLKVVIVADNCLPITLDRAEPWGEVLPGREIEMHAEGVYSLSPQHMAMIWPHLWRTADAARLFEKKRSSDRSSIYNSLYVSDRKIVSAYYKMRGPGEKKRKFIFDAAVISHPRVWLETKLKKAVVSFEIIAADGELQKNTQEQAPIFSVVESAFRFGSKLVVRESNKSFNLLDWRVFLAEGGSAKQHAAK